MSVTISGDTGVSKVQDGVIVQADLASGVVGNGPAFSVYLSATQAISAATFTKVQFNTKRFDTASAYDAGLYRFNPTVAGYYQINAIVTMDYSGSQFTYAELHLYKNGASILRTAAVDVSWYGTQTLSEVVYLNGTTDYLEVYGYIGGGSGPQFLGNNTNRCTFSGALVRAA